MWNSASLPHIANLQPEPATLHLRVQGAFGTTLSGYGDSATGSPAPVTPKSYNGTAELELPVAIQ